jgi:hypothetical protein
MAKVALRSAIRVHIEHTTALYGQNKEFLNVKPGGNYIRKCRR